MVVAGRPEPVVLPHGGEQPVVVGRDQCRRRWLASARWNGGGRDHEIRFGPRHITLGRDASYGDQAEISTRVGRAPQKVSVVHQIRAAHGGERLHRDKTGAVTVGPKPCPPKADASLHIRFLENPSFLAREQCAGRRKIVPRHDNLVRTDS